MPLAVLSFRKTKYFYKGKLDWDERSSAGRYVRENCKALRVQLASLLVFLLSCYLCYNCFLYRYFFLVVVIGLRSGCLHESLLLLQTKTEKKWYSFLVFGIFTWHLRVLIRSFVLFRFKKSVARTHRTFDFNVVPKVLSYPSPTELERKRGRLGDRTWKRGWFDFMSYLYTNLHDDFFLPLRPEFISFFLSYLNLLIPLRFK